MFRGAGSEDEGVGAIEMSVCGQWIFRCAGNEGEGGVADMKILQYLCGQN